MAIKVTATCDKCGHEEVQEGQYFSLEKSGWKKLYLSDSPAYGNSYRNDLKEYLFCSACSEKLGLRVKVTGTTEENKTLADRLLEVIEEIVQGQLPS